MLIDINAYIGNFPFRTLRDNTPEKLIARLDRCGIQMAAVSSIDALFHRHPYSANEKLIHDLSPHQDRLIPIGTINPLSPHWEDDLQECSFINITSAEINKEINKLPSGCKQILTLYLFENYKHREIAQLLKISESTSKSQYQRALKLLRMKLKAYLT